MGNNSAESRLSVLEAREEINSDSVNDIKSTLHSLNEKVGKIEIKLEKSMSFVGGIAFTFSTFGAILVTAMGYVLSKLGIIS
jgi:hypothetical protein